MLVFQLDCKFPSPPSRFLLVSRRTTLKRQLIKDKQKGDQLGVSFSGTRKNGCSPFGALAPQTKGCPQRNTHPYLRFWAWFKGNVSSSSNPQRGTAARGSAPPPHIAGPRSARRSPSSPPNARPPGPALRTRSLASARRLRQTCREVLKMVVLVRRTPFVVGFKGKPKENRHWGKTGSLQTRKKRHYQSALFWTIDMGTFAQPFRMFALKFVAKWEMTPVGCCLKANQKGKVPACSI